MTPSALEANRSISGLSRQTGWARHDTLLKTVGLRSSYPGLTCRLDMALTTSDDEPDGCPFAEKVNP